MTSLIVRAIQNLRPGSHWTLHNDVYSGLIWDDAPGTKPSEVEVNAEIARLQTPAGVEEIRQADEADKVNLAVLKVLRNHENRLRAVENALAIDGVSNRPSITLAQALALVKSLM